MQSIESQSTEAISLPPTVTISLSEIKSLFHTVNDLSRRCTVEVDKDELTQETMLKLLTGNMPRQIPISWLVRNVRCRAIDIARRQARSNRLLSFRSPNIDYTLLESGPCGTVSDDIYLATLASAPEPHPFDEPDVLPAVLSALRSLSPSHRRVITLIALGYTYRAITEITGVPDGTVRSRINYARKCLAPLLVHYL